MKFTARPIRLPRGAAYWLESRASPAMAWERMSERAYFTQCLALLAGDDGLARDTVFLVVSADNDPDDDVDVDDVAPGRRPVLIYLSKESGRRISAKTAARFAAVFQGSLLDAVPQERIYPMPIGAVDGRWSQDAVAGPKSGGIFFSGVLTASRAGPLLAVSRPNDWRTRAYRAAARMPAATAILRRLTNVLGTPPLADGLNGEIHFAGQWAGNLSAERYRDRLRNARIALCPGGYVNPQTFRVYEAASAGCAIVTERLPDRYFHRGNPFIEVDRGGDWLAAVRGLLAEGADRIAERGRAARAFWEERMSPAAAADYIRKQLASEDAI